MVKCSLFAFLTTPFIHRLLISPVLPLYFFSLLSLRTCPIFKLEPKIACSIFIHSAHDLFNTKLKGIDSFVEKKIQQTSTLKKDALRSDFYRDNKEIPVYGEKNLQPHEEDVEACKLLDDEDRVWSVCSLFPQLNFIMDLLYANSWAKFWLNQGFIQGLGGLGKPGKLACIQSLCAFTGESQNIIPVLESISNQGNCDLKS